MIAFVSGDLSYIKAKNGLYYNTKHSPNVHVYLGAVREKVLNTRSSCQGDHWYVFSGMVLGQVV